MESRKPKYLLFIWMFFLLTDQRIFAQSPDSPTAEILKNIHAVENNLAGTDGIEIYHRDAACLGGQI
jgi:hypothetical protein